MPGDPATHDAHRVRLINEATQKRTQATLWLQRGSTQWWPRGDLDPDEEIEGDNYTLEMIDTGARQRFVIERDGDRYDLVTSIRRVL